MKILSSFTRKVENIDGEFKFRQHFVFVFLVFVVLRVDMFIFGFLYGCYLFFFLFVRAKYLWNEFE